MPDPPKPLTNRPRRPALSTQEWHRFTTAVYDALRLPDTAAYDAILEAAAGLVSDLS